MLTLDSRLLDSKDLHQTVWSVLVLLSRLDSITSRLRSKDCRVLSRASRLEFTFSSLESAVSGLSSRDPAASLEIQVWM